jgi:Fe-S cluster assembly protein SufB
MVEPTVAERRTRRSITRRQRYYSAPNARRKTQQPRRSGPELLETFEKLGIPLDEQKRLAGVAVDAVFDSVSVATTHKDILEKRASSFVRSARRCAIIPTW